MQPPRWIVSWIGVAALTAAEPNPVNSLAEAWGRIQVLDFQGARTRFEEIARDPEAREARLGLAASLLSAAPITTARIDRAEALLESLFASGAEDDVAVAARYLHARIPQVHRGIEALRAGSPEQILAERRFRELYSRHPDHPVAQIGMTKLALLRLRGVRVRREEMAARAAEFETLLPRLTSASARQLMHLALANAYLNERVDLPRALHHLVAAERMGIGLLSKRQSVRAQIIGIAQTLGETEILRHQLTVFVAEHPRDNRTYLFRSMLEELEGRRP